MSNRTDLTATTIASLLVAGLTAEVVGGEPLKGEPIRYWIDEHEQAHPMERTMDATPGVVLTQPDGARMLYATATRGAAEVLLATARERAASFVSRQAENTLVEALTASAVRACCNGYLTAKNQRTCGCYSCLARAALTCLAAAPAVQPANEEGTR